MRRLRWALLGLAVTLASCDSGPKGPGSFTASLQVVGPSAGVVMIEVTGPGVRGFDGTGDTEVFHDVPDAVAGAHRLILVSSSGSLGFRVQVDQVENGFPVATVLDAADTDNEPRGPAGIEVRFSN